MPKNQLTEINEGGTHGQNPLGGVPMGQNANVEQGETKSGNFVYSNRIPINEDLVKQFNLPNYIKNKTIADASKAINDKFKDRQDKYATETKNTLLDRLAQAQESIKAQEAQINQSMASNSQQIPDMMNGEIPQGMEEFVEPTQMFMGGELDLTETNGYSDPELAPNTMEGASYLSAGVKMLPSLLSGDKNQIVNSGISTGLGIAGTAIGGPVGGMIGSTIGSAVSPMVNKLLNKNKIAKEKRNNSIIEGAKFNNDFALGGPIGPVKFPKPYGNSLNVPYDPNYVEAPNLKGINGNVYELDNLDEINGYSNPELAPDSKTTNMGKNQYPKANLSKIGDYLNNNGGKFLKYAPAVMNAYQLSKLKKPENKTLDRLSTRYTPEYVDEKSIQNIAGNNMDNTINAISQMGGSEGATRNAILGAGLNRNKAISDAYISANAQNRATNTQAQQFNSGIDQFNAQTQHQESQNWEQNEAAYRNEKSKYLGAIGTDLGEIGKEEVNKNQIADALGYTWDGKYMINKKTGEKVTDEEYENALLKSKSSKAYGGFIKMNKIGRK